MATLSAKVLAQYLKDTFPPTGQRKEEMKRKTEHRLWEEASPFFTSRRGGRAADEAGTAADASRFAERARGAWVIAWWHLLRIPSSCTPLPSGERASERRHQTLSLHTDEHTKTQDLARETDEGRKCHDAYYNYSSGSIGTNVWREKKESGKEGTHFKKTRTKRALETRTDSNT